MLGGFVSQTPDSRLQTPAQLVSVVRAGARIMAARESEVYVCLLHWQRLW